MKKFLFIICIALCWACTGEDSQEVKRGNRSALPEASGEAGEIVIIVNKKKYDKELGDALKDVFQEYVDGLTRSEPMFTLRVIEPSEFNRIFKIARNIVYVTSFEGNSAADKWLQGTFGEESRNRIMNNPELFMQTSEDQYAKNQKVLQLFGKDDNTLIENLLANRKAVQNYFNIAEKQRLAKALKMSSASKMILQQVNNQLGVNIKIPAGYELANLEDDFMWARFLPPVGASKNLFVYYKDYESQDEFEYENVIALRNEIGKKYIYGDPENEESFMITETEFMQPTFRTIDFNNQYTVEMRGAWKTNNFSVGGTFISYTFVDQPSNRLYYIEGFIIHPNEKHRELIREMESLLTTFRSAAP